MFDEAIFMDFLWVGVFLVADGFIYETASRRRLIPFLKDLQLFLSSFWRKVLNHSLLQSKH